MSEYGDHHTRLCLDVHPKVVLSKSPIPNEILQVLHQEKILQAHLNDKPSNI